MPRSEARSKGLIHFQGKECNTCHSTVRYTCNNRCVACLRSGAATTKAAIMAKADLKRAARDAAAARGDKRYQGHDCARNHGAERYTSSGECCECRKLVESAHYKREQALLRASARPVARENPTPDMGDQWVSCIKPIPLSRLMGGRA